ncbi:hypothetical protein B0T17DRAFT_499288, partial [Bombardia bombarda]
LPMTKMDAFFSDKSATRQDCDSFAEKRFGGPITPVNAFANAQFGLVARHQHVGAVGALEVYSMPKLRGDTFVQASLRVAQDSVSIGPEERGRIHSACLARLDILWTTLPELQPAVQHVRNHIDKLFDPDTDYPLVPVHGDLSPSNMLVDRYTGNLTGVIDSGELSFLPLGFDFYALDNIIGEWSPDGWKERASAPSMRAHFWATLVPLMHLSDADIQNIKVAWLAGILFHFGTRSDAGLPGMAGHLNDNDSMGTQMPDELISDSLRRSQKSMPWEGLTYERD